MSQSYWSTGMYYDDDSAEGAVGQLHDWGYGPDDVSVMMRDRDHAEKFAAKTGSKAEKIAEGAAAGAGIGGALGAIIAGLTATGSVIAIAGTGGAAAPLVVGPLAAALAGLGAGGLAGGVVGALVGLGIPEHKAREYDQGLNRGGMLLAVNPREGDRDRVDRLFASNVPTTSESFDTGGSRDEIESRRL